MSDLPSLFLWVVTHHLTSSTEAETLCHIHFIGDLKIILFYWHKNKIQTFKKKKKSECANREEKSLSRKNV
jgi:hypothetical protein